MATTPDCTTVLASSSDMATGRIYSAIRTNLGVIAAAGLVALGTMFLVYWFASCIYDAVSTYRRLLPRNPMSKRSSSGVSAVSAVSAGNDDETYGAARGPQPLVDPDNVRIKTSLARLSDRYAAYNKALLATARRRDGSTTTDGIVDAQVASREHDDYTARHPKDKEDNRNI